MAKIIFEDVANNIGAPMQRARIPNGWIIKNGISITFVPDPTWEWQ